MKYFDFAATAPISKAAANAFIEASIACYGNSESLHDEGAKAKEILEHSRSAIAKLLSVDNRSVIFTSGGTESNMLGISTLLHNAGKQRKHVIVSRIEHPSVDCLLQKLYDDDEIELEYLPHRPDASFCPEALAGMIRPDTALVALQHANSETGALQDICKAAEIMKQSSAYLHVDCVQSFGKTDLSGIAAVADSIAISSHKVRGPKGIGACIFPNVRGLTPLFRSVTHEHGYRSGTVNVPGVYAFAVASKEMMEERETKWEEISILRHALVLSLEQQGIRFEVAGGKEGMQLPHIIAMLCNDIQGQYVMMEMNRRGYSISTGSACQAGMQAPSKTMIAIGKTPDEAKSYIRISLGNEHRSTDCENFATALVEILKPVQNKGAAI